MPFNLQKDNIVPACNQLLKAFNAMSVTVNCEVSSFSESDFKIQLHINEGIWRQLCSDDGLIVKGDSYLVHVQMGPTEYSRREMTENKITIFCVGSPYIDGEVKTEIVFTCCTDANKDNEFSRYCLQQYKKQAMQELEILGKPLHR